MSRPTAAPHARAGAAPHAPHGSGRVGQAETEESLGPPHLPHMPHRISASGGGKHAPGAMKKSLAALAERWEARAAARQATATRPGEAEPVANEAPATLPPAPPTVTPDAWGLTGTERAAALARLKAAAPLPEAPAPPEPPPPPALPPPPADEWLGTIARAIAAAVAEGAERETDEAGFVVLVRPDGSRLAVTPGAALELHRAGLLPTLPEAVARSRFAATARPACWSDPEDVPTEGDRCPCGGRRWWTSAPIPDGWACTNCPPTDHLAPEAVRTVTT